MKKIRTTDKVLPKSKQSNKTVIETMGSKKRGKNKQGEIFTKRRNRKIIECRSEKRKKMQAKEMTY